MTVCIAAISGQDEYIVCACDTLISTATTSFDPLAAKLTGVRGWGVLASGTLSYSDRLVRSFGDKLLAARDNEPKTVEECLNRALLEELPMFSQDKYLTPHGITMADFLAKKNFFTDERRNELSRAIVEYSDNYDCELVVVGWGDKARADTRPPVARIFSADRDGVLFHDTEGFYTSGTGAAIAHSVLAHFNSRRADELEQTIYYVAAAKFMAERSIGVGPNTLFWVAQRHGAPGEWSGFFVQPDEIEQLYQLWREKGQPRMPNEAFGLIDGFISKRLVSGKSAGQP